jgi:hypothetical protein
MSRRLLTAVLFISFAVSCFVQIALAQGQGHGNGQGKGQGKNKQVKDDDRNDERGQIQDDVARKGSINFSTRDRRLIYDYFRGSNSNLPPGLAKRGDNLPPGLQKQLERNGTLPPGLQKRLTPFPRELEVRLPRLPDIYRRGRVGDSVVIIDRRTQRILDVFDAITRP